MIRIWKFLPSFKGKKRLIRLLHKKHINSVRDVTFEIPTDITFSVPNLEETISFNLFFEGHYEKSLVNYLAKEIPKNGTFIDVGANIGAISIILAQLRPDIKIYAFEASPRVFSYLIRNIDQNSIRNIIPINKAIHTSQDILLDFFSPEDNFGKGSFSSVFTTTPEAVTTVRLDRFFEANNIVPDFIKVDVEGFEAMIFESLGKYFNHLSKRPIIIFEFVDWAEELSKIFKPGDAQKMALNNNYSLFDFDALTCGKTIEITIAKESGAGEFIAFPNKI